MSQDLWTAVDRYITDSLVRSDPVLDAALIKSAEAGLPPHSVSANQGKLLQLLACMQGARTILEIGTLGGYSTIWLARALPKDGHLITLEANPRYAEVAQVNIAYANLDDIIDLRIGRALDTLPKLVEEGLTFDLIFIDADKQSNPDYFKWALKLSHKGSTIIVDNVIRDGNVINSESSDPSVQGVRRLNELIAMEKRVTATAIQTVGSKGYDGFAIAIVLS